MTEKEEGGTKGGAKGGAKGAGGTKGGGAGRYVLVTGQSGGGKSSLIANWWRSRTHVSKKEGHARGLLADTSTFIHFIGMTSFFFFLFPSLFVYVLFT